MTVIAFTAQLMTGYLFLCWRHIRRVSFSIQKPIPLEDTHPIL
jgi:hypothetical protein